MKQEQVGKSAVRFGNGVDKLAIEAGLGGRRAISQSRERYTRETKSRHAVKRDGWLRNAAAWLWRRGFRDC